MNVASPTTEQLDALRAFATKYGKNWKERLNDMWWNGTDDREPNGGLLRQLRNRFGPRWLEAFEFSDGPWGQKYLDDMLASYIECALWSTTDTSTESGGFPLDNNYGPDDLSPECERQMREDCESFLTIAWPIVDGSIWSCAEQVGHDFWLTRNGHGAGFWDRYSLGHEYAEEGDRLTKIAKTFGEVTLVVGDDGVIHDL